MQIGDVEVQVLSDGTFKLDAGAVFGLVPRVLWGRVATPDELNRLTLTLNCLLVRSAGKTILIETGYGDKLTQRQQENFGVERERGLVEDLGRVGMRPEDIDIVINTHLHADHAGGNTTRAGERVRPTFPRAEYWIQRGEWEQATHPNERTRATYLSENLEALEASGQLVLFDGDRDVTPEVRCILAPGHTPQHQIVTIASAGHTAYCLGDLAQLQVQLERLAWISAFDVEPLVSLETKRKLVEAAIAQQATIFFIHNSAIGRLVREGDAVHLQPLA